MNSGLKEGSRCPEEEEEEEEEEQEELEGMVVLEKEPVVGNIPTTLPNIRKYIC